MPLEIILSPVIHFLDLEGKIIGSQPMLADFGSLCVHSTVKSPEAWDSVAYPYTVTHKLSGMIVNLFPSLNLACCAAREWAHYDWNLEPDGLPHESNRAQRLALYKAMQATNIFRFAARKGPA